MVLQYLLTVLSNIVTDAHTLQLQTALIECLTVLLEYIIKGLVCLQTYVTQLSTVKLVWYT